MPSIQKFPAIIFGLLLAGCGIHEPHHKTVMDGLADVENQGPRTYQGLRNQDLANQNVLEIIYFWAPWSRKSREFSLELDSLAVEFPNRLRVSKVNIDNNAQWAGKWNITDLPTVLLLQNGGVIKRDAQLVAPSDLRRLVNQAMESGGAVSCFVSD